MTLIKSRKEELEQNFKGPLIKGKTSRALALIANLFREQGIVKNAKDSKVIKAAQNDDAVDVPVSDELVADHEWESLVQTFDPEPDELPHVAADEEDLWEKLSSTRWLKAAAPEVRTATPTSETAAMDAAEGEEAETQA
ncbi:MAG TPA: hypothetical protein VKX17_17315 [Planctomycetota bacterium]|nr:hypothetical protein [Planctomycetota bacterium]